MIQWRADGCDHEVGSREQTREMHFRGRNSSVVGTLVKSSAGAGELRRSWTTDRLWGSMGIWVGS